MFVGKIMKTPMTHQNTQKFTKKEEDSIPPLLV